MTSSIRPKCRLSRSSSPEPPSQTAIQRRASLVPHPRGHVPQRLGDGLLALGPGDVPRLPGGPTAACGGPSLAVLGDGVVDHPHRDHLPLGRTPPRALPADPRQVDRHVGEGAMPSASLCQAQGRTSSKGTLASTRRPACGARGLGGPLHGRLGDRRPAHPGQDDLGGLGEALHGRRQADQLCGAGGQVAVVQAEGGVGRAMAPAAAPAVVITPLDPQGAQRREQPLGPIALEAGGFGAMGAVGAGPYVPPFFRCSSSGLEGPGSDPVDDVAELELGLPEEFVVGLGGQQLGDRPHVLLHGGEHRLVKFLGHAGLLLRQMIERHGGHPP